MSIKLHMNIKKVALIVKFVNDHKHEFKVYLFCVIKLYLYDVSKKYFRKKIIYRQIQIEIVFLCTFENF